MTDTNETCYYLEVSPVDVGSCNALSSEVTIVGSEEAIGTGRKNTAIILAADPNAPASKACIEYNGNGKNDWFLPSFDELRQLFINRSYVGLDEWQNYWSSSLAYGTGFKLVLPNDLDDYSVNGYYVSMPVRAIRAF
jgi:hypothetical protein